MRVLFCLLLPSVISVLLYEYLGKRKLNLKQWGMQYLLAALFVNAWCFLVKCVIMKAGSYYIVYLLTVMPLLSVCKFLAMALAFSVAYAICVFVLQKYVIPSVIKTRLWIVVKSQYETMTVRKVLGLLLGTVFFGGFALAYGKLLLGAVYFLLFAVSGIVTIQTENRVGQYAVSAIYTALILLCLMFFSFYEIFAGMIWEYVRTYTPGNVIGYNCLLILAAIMLINAIVNNWKVSVSIATAVFGLLTVVNGYVYRFRGKEFIFPDIFSVATARNVMHSYDLSLQYQTISGLALLTILVFTGFAFKWVMPKRHLRGRLLSLAACVLLFTSFHLSTKDKSINTWNWDGTLLNGYYLNFYISARDYFVEAPERYSDEYIEMLEARYEAEETKDFAECPNILVIMSESYADFNVLGSQLQTNVPIAPFWESLSENTVKGYALTSVFGGTTANAEFEFLTGFTMRFLPSGTTPYQQYIRENTFSLAWLLDSYGYQCVSTHPYLANGWNRPAVYPLLGFRESTFIDAYPGENLIRSYISDREMFEFVLDELKEESRQPLFLFGITMQNHGGYSPTDANFTKTVSLEGYSGSYPSAETYLSLINQIWLWNI